MGSMYVDITPTVDTCLVSAVLKYAGVLITVIPNEKGPTKVLTLSLRVTLAVNV